MRRLQQIILRISIITEDMLYFIRSYHPAITKWEIFKTYILINIKYYIFSNFFKISNEKILGMKISFSDYKSFHFLFKEIFFKSIYYFKSDKKHSIIFDCGANIGIATLFFKYLYPDCIIYAFEPDPQTFEILNKNIKQNNLKNVYSYKLALLDKKGKIDFYVNKQNQGELRMSILKHKFMKNNIKVEAGLLSDFIGNKQVDFLKMDIEGAEIKVFNELSQKNKIRRIKEFLLEYHHNVADSEAKLSLLLKLFEKNGYNYRINTGSLLIYQRNLFQDILIYGYRKVKAYESK